MNENTTSASQDGALPSLRLTTVSRPMKYFTLDACPEQSGAWHAPNLASIDLRYEIADRSLHFFSQRLHRVAARLPDPHQREEHDGKQHRHPTAVSKL